MQMYQSRSKHSFWNAIRAHAIRTVVRSQIPNILEVLLNKEHEKIHVFV